MSTQHEQPQIPTPYDDEVAKRTARYSPTRDNAAWMERMILEGRRDGYLRALADLGITSDPEGWMVLPIEAMTGYVALPREAVEALLEMAGDANSTLAMEGRGEWDGLSDTIAAIRALMPKEATN